MKKLYLFVLCLVSCIACLHAQAPPKSFNYQAVARDAAGNVLNTQAINIRAGILAGSSSGLLEEEETFSVTTNQFGLFTLQLGQGVHTGGVLPTFASIDWAAADYWLKIEMNTGSGYVLMGSQQLISVPYAMVADTVVHEKNLTLNDLTDVNTAGAANGNSLQYNGTTWVPAATSSALGQTVTAAYGNATMSVLVNATTFTTIPGLTTSITVPAGYSVYVSTYGGFQTQSAASGGFSTIDFGLHVDGVLPTNGGFQRVTALNNTGVGNSLSFWSLAQLVPMAAGTHTIELKAKWNLGAAANVSGDNTTAVQGVLTVMLIKN